MLKQRIITAAILIPLFILIIFKMPPAAFCILTGVFVVIGAYEWSGLMGISSFPNNLVYPVIMVLLLTGSLFLPVPLMVQAACAWWLLATFLVLTYPRASSIWSKGVLWRGIMGALVLIPAWASINFIRNADNGAYALLFLCVLIWGADSGAFFIGRKWGKHKLATLVSPGKTIEGLVGALFVTLLITILTLYFLKVPHGIWLGTILLAFVTVIFSVIGDLFESMLKRKQGLKDSGKIFPGHGGVLDRMDSLTAAAPVFVFGTLLLGKIYQ